MTFPITLETLVTDIAWTQTTSSRTHAQVHDDVNAVVNALQIKVGTDWSTDPDSLDYKIHHLTPRILSAANYTTNTWTSLNCDSYYMFIVTAQAGALKFNNPSWTPVNWQKLWLAVTWTWARALTYDTQFESSAWATLPTTTATTARIDIWLVRRADISKRHCVAVA